MTMNFIVNGKIVSENELEKMFDYMLDEPKWPTVAGMEIAPSRILKAVDADAYRQSLYDWADCEGYYEYEGETK